MVKLTGEDFKRICFSNLKNYWFDLFQVSFNYCENLICNAGKLFCFCFDVVMLTMKYCFSIKQKLTVPN